MPNLPLPTLAFLAVVAAFAVATAVRMLRIANAKRRINALSVQFIDTYFHKVDKIPIIVESIRNHADNPDIYSDVVELHRAAIVSSSHSIYDVAENDLRISREFRFLMRLSMKIPAISRDGDFLYARNLWMFHESQSKKLVDELDREIRAYESLRRSRGSTFFGLFVPVKELFPLRTA